MSALLWAIQFGHDEIVKLLLNYRALYKADESQRARALDLACTSHQATLALMLLARHSREWTETTDGLIFKLDTLKKVKRLGGADIGFTERVNAIVRMGEKAAPRGDGKLDGTMRVSKTISYILQLSSC
jgi:ankyrin repeat protein